MFNIDKMTIGDFKELTKMFNQEQQSDNNPPVKIGQAYLFRTVTHIDLGVVVDVKGQYVTLTDASWIADTGRFHDALKTGELNEIEPYTTVVIVNVASCVDFTPWDHDLPKGQK